MITDQPKSPLQIIENRNFIRHPLCFPLSYRILEKSSGDNARDIPTETINVSLGGLLFSSRHSVEPKSRIAIKLPFENKVFNVRAQVVRCAANPETKLYDIAVSFLRIREAFKAKMVEQIYLIANYRDLLTLQTGKDISLEEASRKWIKKYSARFKRLYW